MKNLNDSCYGCDRKPLTQTNFTKGKWYTYPIWYKNKGTGLQICKRCYDEIFRNKERMKIVQRIWKAQHPERIQVYRQRWDNKFKQFWAEYNTRFLNYKDRRIHFNYNIKTGVCNWCRAVAKIDTKRTHLHHIDDIHFDEDPLKNTIELCTSCHSKETQRLIRMNPNRRRIYPIPYESKIIHT